MAEGVRLVEEALAAGWPFRFVLAGETLSKRGKALLAELQSRRVETEVVAKGLMQTLGETESSQGILAVLEAQAIAHPKIIIICPDPRPDPRSGQPGYTPANGSRGGGAGCFPPTGNRRGFAPRRSSGRGWGLISEFPILPCTWDEIRTHTSGLKIHLADSGRWHALLAGGFCQPAGTDRGRRSGWSQPAGTRTGELRGIDPDAWQERVA